MGKVKSRAEEQELRQGMLQELADKRTLQSYGINYDDLLKEDYRKTVQESKAINADKPKEESEYDKLLYAQQVSTRLNLQLQQNREEMAQNQKWTSQLGNATAKMLTKILTTAVVNAGSIVGLGGMLADYEGNIDDAMETMFPNMRTQEEMDTKWYKRAVTPKYMANFWGDDVLKNMGFTIGAVAGGMVATLPLKALQAPLMARLGRRAFALTETAADRQAAAATIERIIASNTPEKAEKILTQITNMKKGFNFAETAVGSMAASLGEAHIEANQVYREFMEKNTQKLNESLNKNMRKYYDEYMGSKELQNKYGNFSNYIQDKRNGVLAEMDSLASGAASSTFWLNLPVLMAENVLVWGRMFTGGFSSASKALGDLGLRNNVKTIGGKAANNFTGAKRAWEIAKRPVWEGSQEMIQSNISKGSEYYFGSALNDYLKYQLNDEYNKDAVNSIQAFSRGFHDSFLNGDAWMEGFIGALTTIVGIPSIHIVGKSEQTAGKKRVLPISVTMEGSLRNAIKSTRAKYQKIQEAVDLVNDAIGTEEYKKNYTHFIQQLGMQKDMRDALLAGDKLTYKDNEYRSLFTLSTHMYEMGRIEELNQLVDAAKNISERDYNALVDELKTSGKNAQVILSYQDFKKEISDMKDIIDESIETKRKIDERFAGILNDDLLNFMGVSLSLAKNKRDRVKSIFEKYGDTLDPKRFNLNVTTDVNTVIANLFDTLYGKASVKEEDKGKDNYYEKLTESQILDNIKASLPATKNIDPMALEELGNDLRDSWQNLIEYEEYTKAFTQGMLMPEVLGEYYKKQITSRLNASVAKQNKENESKLKDAKSPEEMDDAASAMGPKDAAKKISKIKKEGGSENIDAWEKYKIAQQPVKQLKGDLSTVITHAKDTGLITQKEHDELQKIITFDGGDWKSDSYFRSLMSMHEIQNVLNKIAVDNIDDATKIEKLRDLQEQINSLFTSMHYDDKIEELNNLYKSIIADDVKKQQEALANGTATKSQFQKRWKPFLTNQNDGLAITLYNILSDDCEPIFDNKNNVVGIQTTTKYKDLAITAKANFETLTLSVEVKSGDVSKEIVIDDFGIIFKDVTGDQSVSNIYALLKRDKDLATIKNKIDESEKNGGFVLPFSESNVGKTISKLSDEKQEQLGELDDAIELQKANRQPIPEPETIDNTETPEAGEETPPTPQQQEEQPIVDNTPTWPEKAYNTDVTEFDIQIDGDDKITRHTMQVSRTNEGKSDEEVKLLNDMRDYAKGKGMYDFINRGEFQKQKLLGAEIYFKDITDAEFSTKCIGAYVKTKDGEQLVGILRTDKPSGAFIKANGRKVESTYNLVSKIADNGFIYGSEQFSEDIFENNGNYDYNNLLMNQIADIDKAINNGDVGFFFIGMDKESKIYASKNLGNTVLNKITQLRDEGKINPGSIYVLMPKTSNHLDGNNEKPFAMKVSPKGFTSIFTGNLVADTNTPELVEQDKELFEGTAFQQRIDNIFSEASKITVDNVNDTMKKIQGELNSLLVFSDTGEANGSIKMVGAQFELNYDPKNGITIAATYSPRKDVKMFAIRDDHEMSDTYPLDTFAQGLLDFMMKLNPMFRMSVDSLDGMIHYIKAGLVYSPIKERIYPFNTYFIMDTPTSKESTAVAEVREDVVTSDDESAGPRKTITPEPVVKDEGTVQKEETELQLLTVDEIRNMILNDIKNLLNLTDSDTDEIIINNIENYSPIGGSESRNFFEKRLIDKKDKLQLNKLIAQYKNKQLTSEQYKRIKDCNK